MPPTFYALLYMQDRDRNTPAHILLTKHVSAQMRGMQEAYEKEISEKFYFMFREKIKNTKNKKGQTLLMLAARQHTVDIINLILHYKPNLYLKDINGKTALDYALKSDYPRKGERIKAIANAMRKRKTTNPPKKQITNQEFKKDSAKKEPTPQKNKKRIRLSARGVVMPKKYVKAMVKRLGFFEENWNKSGNFKNEFALKNINGDKVVLDHASGLIWHQSGSEKVLGFKACRDWMRQLNIKGYAGYSNWRLPTLQEACTLLEPGSHGYHISSIFSRKQLCIWTSDRPDRSYQAAWTVDYCFGMISGGFSTAGGHGRPVRRID